MNFAQKHQTCDEPEPPVGPSAWGAAEGETQLQLSADMLDRFQKLVEEVTDELMRGGSGDRDVCRLDAITLLVATCDRMRDEQSGESPLMYLLQEEQQKAAAALGHPLAPAYLKV